MVSILAVAFLSIWNFALDTASVEDALRFGHVLSCLFWCNAPHNQGCKGTARMTFDIASTTLLREQKSTEKKGISN
eukprot:220197-Amphidinium_carterae.1